MRCAREPQDTLARGCRGCASAWGVSSSARTPAPAHGLHRSGFVLQPRAASGSLLQTLLSHARSGPPHRSRDQLPPGTGNAHWAAAMLLRSRDAAGTSAFRRPKVPPLCGHAPARTLWSIGHAPQGSTPSPPAPGFGAAGFLRGRAGGGRRFGRAAREVCASRASGDEA